MGLTNHIESLTVDSIELLQRLIAIPSFSKKENETARLLEQFFSEREIVVHRNGNNVWVFNRMYDAGKPTILLNSHHDTVRPNSGYTRDPFDPAQENGRIYGLGSNDAGGCLVSLIAAFLHFEKREDLRYNLCLAATAEEEISGHGGIESIIEQLGQLDFAIVGEPTSMQMAVAEKGLLVLDVVAEGQSGHAAREEGINAIYQAMDDIRWFSEFSFPLVSPLTGPVKMSVTGIKAGSQHNVVPAHCEFMVDIRLNELYTHDDVLQVIRQYVKGRVTPRSTRLKPSFINLEHSVVRAGIALGLPYYGSPTMSDQALLQIPSLKIGPGESARSHSADEYVEIAEIEEGVKTYVALLDQVLSL